MKFVSEIRGSSFRGKEVVELVKQLDIGESVSLDPDPENPYDKNAVKIIARNVFVGYVQKEISGAVAALLATDAERVSAHVHERLFDNKKTYILIQLKEKVSTDEATRSEFA